MSALKIAVIGGGSTYTPELVSGLSSERGRIEVGELVLQDIDAERRAAVGGLAGRMLDRQGFDGRLSVTDELDAALDGADVVLIQIRVGGQASRYGDETVPLACGCIGQETTGAGGFAKAMRTVPMVLEIAERARQLAAHGAWIIDFTNPVGIVTRALLDAGHRAVGLCNVAIGVQREVAAILEAEPERIAIDQVGLNHLTWVRAARLDGEDVLPVLLAEHGRSARRARRATGRPAARARRDSRPTTCATSTSTTACSPSSVSGCRAPSASRRSSASLLDLYRDPALDSKPALLEQRGGAYYSEAATALVVALHTDSGELQVVDGRNGETLAGLAPDDVVEVPARIGRDGPVPIAQEPLAPELLGLVQHVAAYERLTAEVGGVARPEDRPAGAARPPAGRAMGPQRRAAGSAGRRRGVGRAAAGVRGGGR